MSPLLPMNASEVYQPPASPPDASPLTPPSPQSSSPLLVTYEDHKSNTASAVIAALSFAAIFLALAFLVGYGVYRFGIGFLLGKRVPRKGGGVIGDNGGISTGVSGIHGGGGRCEEGEGKGKEGGGRLEIVIEVPEEEERAEEEEEEEKRRRGDSGGVQEYRIG